MSCDFNKRASPCSTAGTQDAESLCQREHRKTEIMKQKHAGSIIIIISGKRERRRELKWGEKDLSGATLRKVVGGSALSESSRGEAARRASIPPLPILAAPSPGEWVARGQPRGGATSRGQRASCWSRRGRRDRPRTCLAGGPGAEARGGFRLVRQRVVPPAQILRAAGAGRRSPAAGRKGAGS